jgi:hypothetical protein
MNLSRDKPARGSMGVRSLLTAYGSAKKLTSNVQRLA